MHVPEWEIEELLAHNPELLGFPPKELKLVARQKHLKSSGGYIDLLFKKGDIYLVVEVKSTLVNEESVITNQLIPYRKNLANEFGIPEEQIICVLATPTGFSEDVKKLCQEAGIIARELDQNQLVDSLRKLSLKTRYTSSTSLIYDETNINQIIKILGKRGVSLNFEQRSLKDTFTRKEIYDEIRSVNTLLKMGIQDDHAKRKLARLFIQTSQNAPIQAHDVGTDSDGKLTTTHDMWFWLFYSVMDRRANAATFVKAKNALEKERLFPPYKIVELVKSKGERRALSKIARILENSNFPLLNDSIMGKLSFPKSVVDAAKFMSNYSYDFKRLYKEYIDAHQSNLKEARDSVWKDLRKEIYGVGPRIASQIIRGLVLKGPWKFPLDNNKFLEKCRFNVWIAEKTRLSLITDESKYYDELGEFADKFLDGNRGIIAHVLWYIRKRYCNRPPKCGQCKLAGYCNRALLQYVKEIG